MIKILIFTMLTVTAVLGQTVQQTLPFRNSFERKQFGEYLFQKNDFIRAAEEFSFCEQNDTIRFKRALCYIKLNDLGSAVPVIKAVNANDLREKLLQLEFQYLFRSQEYKQLIDRYNEISNTADNENTVKRSYFLSSKFILDHEIDKKILLHNDLPSTFKDTLLRFIQLKKEAPHKSPFVAGVLSGLIPGLGKIYTGFYEDGIAAFIVTGLLGYATYANIKNDHPARAYLSGAFTLFFYSGTVYGSYISAEKYNWAQLVNINLRFNSIMLNENLIPYISETP